MNGDRRSQDSSGFFGVASPPTSSNSRLRPQSAGTRLRQKPAAPSHQDLFATLGIDASGSSARSSFFSNRGSTASVSSTTNGPPTSTASNASLHQFSAPPRGAFAMAPSPPPLPAAAGPPTGASHWSGSSSHFSSSSVTRASPVTTSSTFRSASSTTATSFGARATGSAFGAPSLAPPPAPAATAQPSTSASLFSMEDSDAFELDDGWGCDSPSAVLSPTGVQATPTSAPAPAAAAERESVLSDLNDDDFGWDDAETDKQFGISPPKPAPSASIPAPSTTTPSSLGFHAPPAASPPARSPTTPSPGRFQPSPAPSTFAFSASAAHQQAPAAAATAPPQTVTFAPTVSTSAPAAELEYNERNSWGEPWGDAEPFPDQKHSPTATSAPSGTGSAAAGAASPLAVPAAESIPVENEFWGDQDDDALFDDDEHANEKWDETPVGQATTGALATMSLQDQEAAATSEVTESHTHFQHQQQQQQQPSPSRFGAPPTFSAAPSPASPFGYTASAHASSTATSFSSGQAAVYQSATSPPAEASSHAASAPGVHFASELPPSADDAASPTPTTSGATVAFSGRDEYAPDAPPVSPLYGDTVAHEASGSYFASTSPAKPADAAASLRADAFAQPPQSEQPTSDASATAEQQQQHFASSEAQAATTPSKDWESEQSHASAAFGASTGHWSASAASPHKTEEFSGSFYEQQPEHMESVASVQFETSRVSESHQHHHQYSGGAAHHDGPTASGFESSADAAFRFSANASRDDAQFYASAVRDHETSSTASIGGDVSSAGATFGGSDYVRSETYSDGTFSETRSVFGSSNASTAFGTDFPSVSEGFSAAATTFGGSDYVSDGQFSDGNVSETPSLNDSSHPGLETSPEHLDTHYEHQQQQSFFSETHRADENGADESRPFAMSSSSSSHGSAAFGSGGFPPASPAGLFNHESSTAASDDANPFASSSSSTMFGASPFASAPVESASAAAASEAVPTAASLFGETAGSDVPNPFGDQSSAPSMVENELPVADADNLFASSPTAAGFGAGSFDQPPQQYDQGYQQSYDQGYAQHQQSGYDQASSYNQSHNDFRASAASSSELFSQSQSSYDGFSASPFEQQQQQSSAFGYAQQQASAESVFGGASHHFGESERHFGHQSESAGPATAQVSEDASQHHAGFPPSPAPGANAFAASSASVHSESAHEQTQGFFSHSQQYETPAHDFRHSHSELSSSGFSDSRSSSSQFASSAQGFFGSSASHGGAGDSFASSNEFFGGASSTGDDAAYSQQPSLSRGASDASAYSEQQQQVHSEYQASESSSHFQHHDQQQQQQSWPPAGEYAQSGFSDSGFAAPPQDSFESAAATAVSNEAPVQSSEEAAPDARATAFGHSGASETESSFAETTAAHGASDSSQFTQSHFASTSFQHHDGGAQASGPPASSPPTPAPELQQQQDDSSNYFGSAPQANDGFANQFGGHASDSTGLFAGQPPQDQPQQHAAYFGEQSHAPEAYSGFEQSAPSGFGASNGAPSSEFFASPPQQHQQHQSGGAAFSANNTSASYHQQQQHQTFQQSAHGYTSSAPSAAPAPHGAGQFNNYGTQPAAAGHAPPTATYHGAHAQAHEASSSYAGSYNAAPTHSYSAGYSGAHSQAPAVQQSSKYKDPCVPAPSCLASFGFGGNVVTMFPKRKLRLNIAGSSFRNSPRAPVPSHPETSELGELRKGPVHVYRMDQIHPRDRHFEQLEAFPGPLTEHVSEDVVLQYLDSQLKDAAALSSLQEDERLLSGILRILVKCNGKLRSDPSGNPNDPDSPEVQLVTLLRESDYRRRGNQAPTFPTPKPVQSGVHPDALVKQSTQVRDLLLVGDRKAAVDVAIHAQMWPEAMLIASFTDKDEYKRVLRTYLESHYAIGDPCRALYMSFADQQEKSVQEPQKLLQLHHATQQQQSASSSSILASWVTHAQVLLANRTGDTNKILVELGDRLWKETGSILAAHVCYLAAGIPVDAPSPSSKIALLGADHRTPKEARFYVSSSAVQRTEIYEWIQKRATGSATNMIPFQGYKLIYAMILADHGKLEASFKYVSAMLAVIKGVTATMKPGTSMYLEGMQNQLTVLDDRLRQHLGQHRVNSVASASSAKQGKWGFGSALSIMGKIVNRVVEGSDGSGAPAAGAGASGPQPGGGSSLFPGAPRAPNPNASPAFTGLAQQPAPLSNSGRPVPLRAPSPVYTGYSQQPQAPAASSFSAPRSNDRSAVPPFQSPAPTPSYSGFGQQHPPRSNDASAYHPPSTPSQTYAGYSQQPGLRPTLSSNDLHAPPPPFPNTPSQSFQHSYSHHSGAPSMDPHRMTPRTSDAMSYPGTPLQQPGLRPTLSSNDLHAPPPPFPSTPSQSFQQQQQQQSYSHAADPYSAPPLSSSGVAGFPSPAFGGYNSALPPRLNDGNAPSAFPTPQPQAFAGYSQQPPPRSRDATGPAGYAREQQQQQQQHGFGGYNQQQQQFSGPRSNESSASRQGYAREQPHGFGGYSQQQQHQPPPPHGTPQFAAAPTPSGSDSHAQSSHFAGNGPNAHDRYAPPARSMTAPPPSSGSDNGPPSSQGGSGFHHQPPPHQQQQYSSQPHVSNSAPNSMPASPSTFQKPTLDLSGDAGKGVAVPPRRASDKPRSPTATAAAAAPGDGPPPSSGPSSDKGSASPKFKDTKKTGRSKTPPPSGSKSGWFSGMIGNFLVKKMNPEATVAKVGDDMKAYYDEEKKRWVFPGEAAVDEPAIPSAPPIGPLPGSTPGSSSGGPPGPPGTHSAPGSLSTGASAADPLAALMAPPPARAHAALMKKDPVAAMMAPPMRPGMPGQRAMSMGAQRKPPRPQFAVFKPAPQAPAPAPEAADE